MQPDGVLPGVATEQSDLAVVVSEDPQENADGGGLPGTVRAEKPVDLPLPYLESEAVEGGDVAELLGDAAEIDGGAEVKSVARAEAVMVSPR